MTAPSPRLSADPRARVFVDRSTGEVRQWWQTRTAALLLIAIAVVPLLYPAVPPLVDLPGHMGRYRVELDLASSPELQRHFTFAWSLIGNLGIDLLIIPFAKLFGLELGTKLIVASIPALTVAGFLAVAREVHGRVPATALFALPLAYNHAFQFGFVNFSLSMALCFLAFALWLKLGREARFTLRAWLFAPLGLALFVVHAFGWGCLCLLAFSAELVRQWRGQWLGALFGAGKACLVLALPLVPLLAWRGDGTAAPLERWFDLELKLTWLAGVFRDQWKALDLLFAGALLAVIVEARRRPNLGFAPTLVAATAVLAAAFLLLPWKVLGSAYADMRLAPYLLATALLAISFKQTGSGQERRWALLGTAFFTAVLLARTASFGFAAQDQQRQFAALDRVPVGARVVALAGRPCSDGWAMPRNFHYASMVVVRRRGFANDQWLMSGANLLGARENIGRFTDDPSQATLPPECATETIWSVDRSLAALPPGWFDYLWLIDAKPADPRLLSGYDKVWQSGNSALYRLR